VLGAQREEPGNEVDDTTPLSVDGDLNKHGCIDGMHKEWQESLTRYSYQTLGVETRNFENETHDQSYDLHCLDPAASL
jgi:hypothetical protein